MLISSIQCESYLLCYRSGCPTYGKAHIPCYTDVQRISAFFCGIKADSPRLALFRIIARARIPIVPKSHSQILAFQLDPPKAHQMSAEYPPDVSRIVHQMSAGLSAGCPPANIRRTLGRHSANIRRTSGELPADPTGRQGSGI